MPKYGMESVKAPTYAANQRRTVELRQRNVVASYLLVLTLDYLMTGGTGVGAIYSDGLFRMLQRVELIIGGTARQVYSGQFLRLLHLLMGQETWQQTPPTLLTAAASQTARKAYFELPLQMPHSYTGEEFGLPTQMVDAPTLAVTWGAIADVFNEAIDGVPSSSNEVVELYEIPILDPAIAPANHQALEIQQQYLDIVSTGQQKITLDTLLPGSELRAVYIEAFGGGLAGTDFEYSDAVVTQVRLIINGKAIFERVPWVVVQNRNKVRYQLAAIEPGVVVLDSSEDKRTGLGELFVIAGAEKPYLELDVTKISGDNRIRITTLAVSTRVRRAA